MIAEQRNIVDQLTQQLAEREKTINDKEQQLAKTEKDLKNEVGFNLNFAATTQATVLCILATS